jgi:hypothetical protein
MLIIALLMLAVLAALVYMEHTKLLKKRKHYPLLYIIAVVSELLAWLHSYLGNRYVLNYQNVHNACPPSNIYADLTGVFGVISIAAGGAILYFAIHKKHAKDIIMSIVFLGALLLLSMLALVASSFCIGANLLTF